MSLNTRDLPSWKLWIPVQFCVFLSFLLTYGGLFLHDSQFPLIVQYHQQYFADIFNARIMLGTPETTFWIHLHCYFMLLKGDHWKQEENGPKTKQSHLDAWITSVFCGAMEAWWRGEMEARKESECNQAVLCPRTILAVQGCDAVWSLHFSSIKRS